MVISINENTPLEKTTVQAAVLPAPGQKIELRHFAKPELVHGEVLMRTIYSEVCGTDVHLQQGNLEGVPYPIIPGHFAVGTVEDVCGNPRSVSDRPVLRDDIITFLDVHSTCHRCWQCQVDKTPTKCLSRKIYGVTHSSNEGLLGGWSENILLQNDVTITHLPENMSPLRFISGGCAMPTAVHAAMRGKVGLNDIVVVQGAGPVGLCAAIVAYQTGARAFITDMSSVRLEAASNLGFETLDLTQDSDVLEALKTATSGRKADVVIEATGAPDAVQSGIRLVRDGGRYVIVGHYSDSGNTTINPYRDVNKKHLEILGTWGVEYIHFHHALELLARDNLSPSGVKFEDVMTTIYPLSEVETALEDVRTRRVIKAVISAQ